MNVLRWLIRWFWPTVKRLHPVAQLEALVYGDHFDPAVTCIPRTVSARPLAQALATNPVALIVTSSQLARWIEENATNLCVILENQPVDEFSVIGYVGGVVIYECALEVEIGNTLDLVAVHSRSQLWDYYRVQV